MAAKRIILRGISHTPSDLRVDDGGCAESLNVQLREGELTPMLQPQDITSELLPEAVGESGTVSYIPIFIHKTNTYTNYIGKSSTTPTVLHFYVQDIGWLDPLTQTLNAGETIVDVKSIGNCVTVLTNVRTLWLLFKDNTYKLLGDKIPEPEVIFYSEHPEVEYVAFTENDLDPYITSVGALFLNSGEFNRYIVKDGTSARISDAYPENSVTETFSRVVDYLWMQVNSKNQENRNSLLFPYPVFLVYALKVAGEYVNISAPILAGLPSMDGAQLSIEHDDVAPFTLSFRFGAHKCGIKVKVRWDISGQYAAWADLIESVDIFASTDMRQIPNGTRFEKAFSESPDDGDFEVTFKHHTTPEQQINNVDSFYLIHSIPYSEISTDWNEKTLKPYPQDELVVRKKLPYNFRTANNPQPLTSIMAYNNRLVGAGLREVITRGYGFFQSCETEIKQLLPEQDPPDIYPIYSFRFVLQEGDGSIFYVLPVNYNADSPTFQFESKKVLSPDKYIQYTMYGLIMYPDSRCTRVDVRKVSSAGGEPEFYSLPMKKHPSLDCAYFFAGDKDFPLDIILPSYESENVFEPSASSDRREILSPRKLIQSSVDLSFVYPLSGRQNFSAKITGVATTTIALATSQFGTSDLYVFTEEGIEAQSIDAEGELINHKSVSRDVAIASTICPIDNAIVFSTERGVMLLEQGKVTCISDNMVGKHFILDDTEGAPGHAILDVLRSAGFSNFVNTIKDNTPFPSFVRNAKAIYDYAGNRLIFFNPEEEYQYVFMLNTATWHKMLKNDIATGERFINGLNSYPDAYAVFGSVGAYKIINFSTPLASIQEQDALDAVIITRPLDFDVPDSYKSIEKLFPRGEFERGKIKYLVMVSNDGITYHMVNSLRGPSWKYYRLLVISTMGATDKLSYIDAEINARFNNKLR